MTFDVQRIFGIAAVQRHEHKSSIEPPQLTPPQIDIVRNVFAEDFALYEQQSWLPGHASVAQLTTELARSLTKAGM
jgi:hypothetical protein